MKPFRAALLVAGAGLGAAFLAVVGVAPGPGVASAYFPSASFSPSSYPQDQPNFDSVFAYDAIGGYNGGWSAFYPDGSWYGIGSYIVGPDGTQATSSFVTAAQMGLAPTTTPGAYTVVVIYGENPRADVCVSPSATLSACTGWAGGNAYTAALTVTPAADPPLADPPAPPEPPAPPAPKYSFGGFLPPVEADGLGIYKQGRTLPIKFALTDAQSGAVAADAIARLSLSKISGAIVGSEEVAVPFSAADNGNEFRYDAGSNEYIFNLDTSRLEKGTWRLEVGLDDGTSYSVNISVR